MLFSPLAMWLGTAEAIVFCSLFCGAMAAAFAIHEFNRRPARSEIIARYIALGAVSLLMGSLAIGINMIPPTNYPNYAAVEIAQHPRWLMCISAILLTAATVILGILMYLGHLYLSEEKKACESPSQ